MRRKAKTNTTEVLSDETGGTTFGFARQKALEDLIQRLGQELHTQYVLNFQPETTDPAYHRIEVRIRRAGDLRVRARPGYFSGAVQ